VPFWITNYKYGDKDFHVYMDGTTTNRLQGLRPEDAARRKEVNKKFIPGHILAVLFVLSWGMDSFDSTFFWIGLLIVGTAYGIGFYQKEKIINASKARRQEILRNLQGGAPIAQDSDATNVPSMQPLTLEAPSNNKRLKVVLGSAIAIVAVGAVLWYYLKGNADELQASPNVTAEQNGLSGQAEQTTNSNVASGIIDPGQPVTYNGAWFSINYPSNFQARGSMRSSISPDNYESATFTSPDNTVQFYVFSPQWRADATDIGVSPGESMGSTKTENNADGQIKWWTITANDGSYSRSYMERINSTENTNLIFGIRYTSASALDSYKQFYEAFKASLKQYSDGEEDYGIDSNDGSIAYIIDPPSNVRSCPNTSCDVVAECKTKNETVKIISVEGNWAMIETNSGARGYLHSSQYTQNTSGKVFTATVDKLRFRETPSFNGVVIREVSMGTTFTYLNEQTNMLETAKIAGQELPGYWYRVRAQDGREGWVHGCCISGI